jgi:surfeit locus 1 family protein
MPIRFSAFGRVFAPHWAMTLATLVFLALFVSLGRWQWHRGEVKQQVLEDFEHSSTQAPVWLPADLDEAPRYLVVRMKGHFDSDHQFLLDNRFFKGRPGYEALTPFVLEDGRRVLVNRGWLPFTGRRDELPDLTIQQDRPVVEYVIDGRLDELPSAGLASGRAPPTPDASWPKLTSFPSHEELEAAYHQRLERRIVLLTSQAYGLEHDWAPTGIAPDRHFSYAIQWWGFALVLLVLYFGLNFRKVP